MLRAAFVVCALACFATAGPAGGQSSNPYAQKKGTPRTVLFGRVLDAENRPLPGATVSVEGKSRDTDDSGSFLLRDLPAGQPIEVSVEKGQAHSIERVVLEPYSGKERVFYLRHSETPAFVSELGIENEIVRSPGLNRFASPYPGGRLLAVETLDSNTLGFDIVDVDRAGSRRSSRAATNEDDAHPRIARDSMALVFHTSVRGEGYRVWRQDHPWVPPVFVDQGRTPTWSHDGQSIIYARESGGNLDLFRVAPSGSTEPTQLTHHPAKDWDPDAGLVAGRPVIAFVSDRTGRSEIWLMDDTSREARRLTTIGQVSSRDVKGPAISPDGSQIAFWQKGDEPTLWIMNADGSGARPLVRNARAPSWSLEDRSLYFASRHGGSWQVWRTPVPPPSEAGPLDPHALDELRATSAREKEAVPPPAPMILER